MGRLAALEWRHEHHEPAGDRPGSPSPDPAGLCQIGAVSPYRCTACGNKTRFDVLESKRVRSFLHFTLGGELTVEEEEVLDRTIEKVTCRWCGSSTAVAGEVGSSGAP
jgi:hypothetical protein